MLFAYIQIITCSELLVHMSCFNETRFIQHIIYFILCKIIPKKKQRMENAREVLFNNIVKKRSRGGVDQE